MVVVTVVMVVVVVAVVAVVAVVMVVVMVMVMVTVVIGDYLELGFYQFNALPLVTVADNTHVIVKKVEWE